MARLEAARRTADLWIIAAASMLLGASAFLLTGHRIELAFEDWSSAPLPRIGQVRSAGDQVSRRLPLSVKWLPLFARDWVHPGDHVYSGAGSQADIGLSDGALLHLAPDTLVVLRQQDGVSLLELRHGEVAGSLGRHRRLLVAIDEDITELSSEGSEARIELSAGEDRPHGVSSPDGSARIRPVLRRAPPRTASFRPQAPVAPKADAPEAVVGLLPKNGARFVLGLLEPGNTAPGLPVDLEWKGISSGAYEVELAEESSFSARVERWEAAVARVRTRRLKPGTYYWRARAKRSAGAWSPAHSFEIVESGRALEESPSLRAPAPEENLPLLGARTPIRFAWSKRAGAIAYRIEIARQPDFAPSSRLVSARLAGSAFEQRFSRPGVFFWRVRAVLPTGEMTRFSEPRRFRIRLSQPKLRRHEVDYEGFNDLRPSPRIWFARAFGLLLAEADAAENTPGGPILDWEPVAGAERYRLEIARTPDLRAPVLKQDLSEHTYQWKQYQPGRYYWRVTALDATGAPGLPSAPSLLVVRLSPPLLAPPKPQDGAVSGIPSVRLEWSAVPGTRRYEAQVSTDREFKVPRSLFSSEISVLVQPEREGAHFARVRALSSDGRPVTRFSGVESFGATRVPAPTAAPERSPRAIRSVVTLGVAMSRESYQDSQATSYSTWGLDVFAQAGAPWTGTRFDWAARGEVVAVSTGGSLAIAMPGVDASTVAPRFLSLNASLGWISAWLPAPWLLAIRVGAFYDTMWSSPFLFGYQNVWGPELFPELKRSWGGGQTAALKIKFSPAIPPTSSSGFSSQQLSLGGEYAWPDEAGHAFRVQLNYSLLRLNPGGASATRQSVSLGLGYGL